MEIINKRNQQIGTIKEWEKEIPKKDWVEGRSSYSLANFILNMNGLEQIKHIIKEILEEDIVFEKGIPEYEVKFDKFNGRGRFHDLGIWGKTNLTNKTFFIGIESKVDEPFGQTVAEAYISGITKRLNGENTNLPDRVEKLIKQNFGDKIKSKHFDIRYQLLYTTIGTLEVKTDISICLIIVFKNNSYDKIKGNENYRDYCQFIQNVISEKKPCNIDNVEVNKLTIDRRKIYSIFTEIEFD
ncbi:MAG: hypothetical protein WAO24_08915 [Peptococcia bacterium]